MRSLLFYCIFLFISTGKPLELSSINFSDKIDQKKAVFVKFYSPGCGHCRSLIPVWEKLNDNLSKHIDVASVNCQNANDLCQKYQIKGVPTLKLFTISDVDDSRLVLDYTGQRSLNELISFGKRHAVSFVYRVKKGEVSSFEARSYKRTISFKEFVNMGAKLPKAVLVKTSDTVSFPLKSLSVKYYKKIVIGQINIPDFQAIADKIGIQTAIDADSFVLIPPNSSTKTIIHQGSLTYSSLCDFLDKYSRIEDWDKLEL